MRRTIEIVGVTNPSGAGRVSANLPVPLDYISHVPFNTNALSTPADITQIKVTLNADPVRLYDGATQDLMNVFDKMMAFDATNAPTTGSALVIPYEMVNMLTPVAAYSTTLNCLSPDPVTGSAINNVRLEWVQTSANAWRLFAVVDDATKGGPGGIQRILQFSDTVAGGAEYSTYNKVPFGSPERRYLRRMFLSLSAGTFLTGDTRILRDTGLEEIFKRPKLLNDQLTQDGNKRTAVTVTSKYYMDTTETGMPEMFDTMQAVAKGTPGAVQMGADEFVKERVFDIRPYPSAGATLTQTYETIGRL